MLRQSVEVLVLQVLYDRSHCLDLANAFTHQKKLVEDEESWLAGERGKLLHLGVAILAMAGVAKLDFLSQSLILRQRGADVEHDGHQPEGWRPPPFCITVCHVHTYRVAAAV